MNNPVFKQSLKGFYSRHMTSPGSEFLFFELMNYRLIDWKKGQIRGEQADTFKLHIRFDELERSSFDIDDIVDTALKISPLAKQIDVGVKVPWTKPNGQSDENSTHSSEQNIDLFRARALDLIDNPDKLIEVYIDLMKSFLPVL